MAGEYRAITDGLILVATIVGWEYVLDVLSFHFPAFGRLIERPPLPVIENGKVLHANLRRELLTEDELLSQLRQKGIDDVGCVKKSFIEGDGSISVIANEKSTPLQSQDDDPAVGA